MWDIIQKTVESFECHVVRLGAIKFFSYKILKVVIFLSDVEAINLFNVKTCILSKGKNFATDINIWDLNNTHVMLRNVAVSGKLTSCNQFYANIIFSFPVYTLLCRIAAECCRRHMS